MYVAITAIGLSLALGASLLILAFVNYELSFEDCHENADQTYRVGGKWTKDDLTIFMSSIMYPLGPSLKDAVPEIEEQVRLRRFENVVVKTDRNQMVNEPKFLLADPSVFKVFSVPLIHGDPEKVLSRPLSVVISEKVARDLFEGNDPLGQTLTIRDSVVLSVTGVMADMPLNTQIHTDFIASFASLEVMGEDLNQWSDRESFNAYTYVLLREGGDPKTVDEKLPIVLASHLGEDADYYQLNLQPLDDLYLHSHPSDELGPTGSLSDVYLFAGISLLLVLMACFNHVNLSVSRVYSRQREVVARSIAGASRSQLFMQFLSESVLLTSFAMVLGLVFYEFSVPYLEGYVGKSLDVGLSNNAFVWIAAPALVFMVGVVSGSYPAATLLRLRPQGVLTNRLSVGSGKSKLRRCLVICQAFIAIGIVGFTVGMQQQLNFIESYDHGFESGNTWLIEFDEEATQDRKLRLKREFQHAGLTDVTLAAIAPGESCVYMMMARPADRDKSESQYLSFFSGDDDYCSTFGLDVIQGNPLTDESVADVPGAVLLNESAVELLALKNPIGTELASSRGPLKVVGVVKDFLALSLHNKLMSSVIIRNAVPDRILAVHLPEEGQEVWKQRMQDIWAGIFPNTVFAYRPLSQVMAASYTDERKLISLLSLSSVLSIFIACLGLLGLASFMVERRTKEVGIRKSIGASVTSIVRLLTSEFVALVAVAGLLAWPLTNYSVTRWLENFAYRIEFEWSTHALVVIAILILSLCTVGLQVVKAATANPIEALRHE